MDVRLRPTVGYVEVDVCVYAGGCAVAVVPFATAAAVAAMSVLLRLDPEVEVVRPWLLPPSTLVSPRPSRELRRDEDEG